MEDIDSIPIDTKEYLKHLGITKWKTHEKEIKQSPKIQSISNKESQKILDDLEKQYDDDYNELKYIVENGLHTKEDKLLAAQFVTTTKLAIANQADKIEEEITEQSRKIDEKEDGILVKTGTAAWNLIVYLGGILYSMYQYGWSLVKWIFYHPTITNFILRMFLLVKKKFCEYFYGEITEILPPNQFVSFNQLLKYIPYKNSTKNKIIQTLVKTLNWSINEFGSWMNACEHELSKSLKTGFNFLRYFSPNYVLDPEAYGWVTGSIIWNTAIYKFTWNLAILKNLIITPMIQDKIARLLLTGCQGFLNFGPCGIPLIQKKSSKSINLVDAGDSDDGDDPKFPQIKPPSPSFRVNDVINKAEYASKQFAAAGKIEPGWMAIANVYGIVALQIIIKLYRLGIPLPNAINILNTANPDVLREVINNPDVDARQLFDVIDDEVTEEF